VIQDFKKLKYNISFGHKERCWCWKATGWIMENAFEFTIPVIYATSPADISKNRAKYEAISIEAFRMAYEKEVRRQTWT